MKASTLIVILFSSSLCFSAQIVDVVAFYRSSSQYPAPAVLLKWQADINGDGKSETLLTRKVDHDEDVAARQLPSWETFIASATADTFTESTGVQNQDDDSFGVGAAPQIDIKACFVGQVTELGQRALLTQQVDNPRVGDPIARIYAYKIEGDHLKRTKLAEYNPMQPNALFDKYLKDGKRTIITLVEVTQ
ncbi:MAG: hypothetical protein ORN51_05660 [Akkermansiaceae bacterium]|nr:hypothetical protein [Akkermansiaceae bacterium]